MKLKTFSPSAQEVIKTICSIDPNQSDEFIHSSISDIITKFYNELDLELKTTQKADKPWRLKRRELALFYDITMLPSPNHFVTKIEYAKEILSSFNKLTSSETLNDSKLLYPLIHNGLVFLTNEEIELLIKNNNLKDK